ncbi:type II secretion system F family protein [Caldiplasma sukawensis]
MDSGREIKLKEKTEKPTKFKLMKEKDKMTSVIPKLGAFDRLSIKLFGNLVQKYADTTNIDLALQKARIPLTGVEYYSRGLFIALIMIPVTLIAADFLEFLIPSFGYLVFAFWFLIIVVYFSVLAEYPNSVAGTRRKKIDALLPSAMSFIATMASADVPVENIIYELSNNKDYGEVSTEAKFISINTRIFGKDIVSSLKEAATYTPSQRFSEFLQGIITTMTSGGDIKEYFKEKALQFQTELSTLIKRNTESLSVLAESYIIVGIMFPLILMVIIGTLTTVIPGESGLTVVVLYLIVFLIIPIIAGMFALILSSTIGEVKV